MADPVEIRIDSAPVLLALRHLVMAGHNITEAFRAVAMSLLSATEKRLANEGPGWPEPPSNH